MTLKDLLNVHPCEESFVKSKIEKYQLLNIKQFKLQYINNKYNLEKEEYKPEFDKYIKDRNDYLNYMIEITKNDIYSIINDLFTLTNDKGAIVTLPKGITLDMKITLQEYDYFNDPETDPLKSVLKQILNNYFRLYKLINGDIPSKTKQNYGFVHNFYINISNVNNGDVTLRQLIYYMGRDIIDALMSDLAVKSIM